MQRMTAATVALALCFFAATDRIVAPRQTSPLRIVLHLAGTPPPHGSEGLLTVTIEVDDHCGRVAEHWCETSLFRFFDAWRQSAQDALFKQLHMA